MSKAYFISEVAQAHDGSLLMAHSMIESSKKAGFDAVKFQAHFAVHESSEDEKFRVELHKIEVLLREYKLERRTSRNIVKAYKKCKHLESAPIFPPTPTATTGILNS